MADDGLDITESRLPDQTLPATVSEEEASFKSWAWTETAGSRMTPQGKEAEYERVRNVLLQFGVSEEVESYERTITQYRQGQSTNAILDVLPPRRPEEAIDEITEIVEHGGVKVEDEVLIRAGEEAEHDPTRLTDEQYWIGAPYDHREYVRQKRASQDAVDNALAPIVADMDPSTASLLGDFIAEGAVPFALSHFSGKLAFTLEDIEGGSLTDKVVAYIRGFALPGEGRNDIRELIANIPEADRPKVARDIAIAVRERSGVIFDNDTETIDWIEHVVSSADEDRQGFDWDRTLFNLITLLDAVPFLTKAIRSGRTSIKTFFSEAARVNRRKLADWLDETITNGDSLKVVLASPETVATGQLPKVVIRDLDSTPDVVSGTFRILLPKQTSLVNAIDSRAINFSADELNKVGERLAVAYSELQGGHLINNKNLIDVSQGDRVVVDAFYARNAHESGWNSLLATLKAAKKMTDGDLAGVRVLARNADGGFDDVMTGQELRNQLRGAKSGVVDGNEYFIQIRKTHFLDEMDLQAFGGNPVLFTGPFGNRGGRYLFEPAGQFSEEVWKPAYVAVAKEQQFIRDAISIAEPFWKAPRKVRNDVVEILEQGAAEGRLYTPNELVGLKPDITVEGMKAYYGMRAAQDAMWAVANNRVRKEMSANGFRRLVAIDGSMEDVFARPLRQGDAKPKTAYNPRTKKIEELTDERIAALESRGGGIHVVHKNDLKRDGGAATRYVIHDPLARTEWVDLPTNVLRYEQGYITRIYKDPFFIMRPERVMLNGKRETVDTVAVTARTEAEAREAAAELTRKTGIEHRVADSELDEGYSKLVNDTMLLEEGRLVYGPRKTDGLTRIDGTNTPVEDPVTAMHRAVNAIGRTIGIEDYVRLQEKKFFQTFKDIIPRDMMVKYQNAQIHANELLDLMKSKRNKVSGPEGRRWAEATQLWAYYQMLRGVSEPVGMRAWRGMLRRVAYRVETILGSRTGAEWIQNLSTLDPFRGTKGTVFTALISANPIRQFALQAAQFSFLSMMNPRRALVAVPQSGAIRLGMATIDTPNWPAHRKGIAKFLGTSEEEAEILVRQFKESGLVAAIDSYGYIGATLTEPSMTHQTGLMGIAGQNVGNAVKWPFQQMKKIGFDEGETLNLSATWTYAAKEFIERSGKKIKDITPREWQEITAQASGYALGMHKAGTYAYQQGFFSTLTQFWSIQQKAFSAMWPAGAGGSQAFTGRQKALVGAWQLTLWGAGGIGIQSFVRDWMAQSGILDDMPEDQAQLVTRIVANGAGEMLLNWALSTDEQKVDVNWSGSFAPAGAPVETVTEFFYTALVDGGAMNALAQETAAGATFGRFSDVARFWQLALNTTHRRPEDPGTLEEMLRSAPTVLSGYSNAVKALYAFRTGQLVTQFGDHKVDITYREAIIRGLLGVQTNEEVDLRRLYGLDNRGFAVNRDMAQEVAAEIYRAVNTRMQLAARAGDTDLERILLGMQAELAIMQIFDEHEAESIRQEFVKIAKGRQNTPNDVFKRVYDMAFSGESTPEHMISEVRTNIFANPQGETNPEFAAEREALIKLLEGIIKERGDLHEIIRDIDAEELERRGFYGDTE